LNFVTSGDATHLLGRLDAGDGTAADRLLPLVYDELRRLAAAKLARESEAFTLQPTALVHEAWLRLGGEAQTEWKDRAHFFAAAAEAMRRILIDEARRRGAARRGDGERPLRVDATGFDVAAPEADDATLLAVSEALDNLSRQDPRKAELIKQWYFIGLTAAEAAEAMGISVRTAEREWRFAKAWLVTEIERLRG